MFGKSLLSGDEKGSFSVPQVEERLKPGKMLSVREEGSRLFPVWEEEGSSIVDSREETRCLLTSQLSSVLIGSSFREVIKVHQMNLLILVVNKNKTGLVIKALTNDLKEG